MIATLGMQTAAATAAVCFAASEKGSETPGAAAPDVSDPFASSGGSGGDTLVMIVKVIFFLIIIIGIFFLIMKVLAKRNSWMTGRSIRSLGGLPLGQNKSIQVVEIGRSLYIVGVGENIQLLEKIDDQAEVESITEMMNVSTQNFAAPGLESAMSWLKNLRKPPVEEEEVDVTASFQQVFHSKMQGVAGRKKMMEEMMNQDSNAERLNDKHGKHQDE
ncbi:flagellar biosynthetic protein FliO [Paenibacillus caseinilyticus]|nr:flagellar biosynthetic protein FliO [Paenibacillus caseinilyticus]MCZ8520043.1 flagellar biosynthetic protein FliO [Paenibacillus caseinilyticus]